MLIQSIFLVCLTRGSPAVDFFKDNPGAYDLGELDQALFSYLEGDSSGLAQKRKCMLYINSLFQIMESKFSDVVSVNSDVHGR